MASNNLTEFEHENIIRCSTTLWAYIGRRLGELLVGKKKGEIDPKKYLTREEAEEYMGASKRAFRRMLDDPDGPKPTGFGSFIRDELEEYAKRKKKI